MMLKPLLLFLVCDICGMSNALKMLGGKGKNKKVKPPRPTNLALRFIESSWLDDDEKAGNTKKKDGDDEKDDDDEKAGNTKKKDDDEEAGYTKKKWIPYFMEDERICSLWSNRMPAVPPQRAWIFTHRANNCDNSQLLLKEHRLRPSMRNKWLEEGKKWGSEVAKIFTEFKSDSGLSSTPFASNVRNEYGGLSGSFEFVTNNDASLQKGQKVNLNKELLRQILEKAKWSLKHFIQSTKWTWSWSEKDVGKAEERESSFGEVIKGNETVLAKIEKIWQPTNAYASIDVVYMVNIITPTFIPGVYVLPEHIAE